MPGELGGTGDIIVACLSVPPGCEPGLPSLVLSNLQLFMFLF